MVVTPARRWVFRILGLALSLLLLEVCCFVVLSIRSGRPVGWSTLAAQLGEASRGGDAAVDFDRPDEQIAQPVQVMATVLHPYLGFVRDPATVSGYDSEAMDHGFTQNRGLFFEPGRDRVVVAVLGGSMARYLAVQEDALGKALGETPRFAGKEVIVASLAMGAYKQPQPLMTLNYFLALGAHFDLVVSLDGFNDIVLPATWNVPRGVFPFFPQHWELRVADLDLPTRRRIGEMTYLRERRRGTAERFARLPLRFSFTAGLVWTILDLRSEARIGRVEEALRTVAEDGDLGFEALGPSRSYQDASAMYRDLVDIWKRGSIQLDGLCRGLGIEYHHFLQPNQYVPESKPLSNQELKTAFRENHRYRPHVVTAYPLLQAAGQELADAGISFHDLTPIFAGDPSTLYRDDCCHVNSEGNALLAQAVARAIADSRRAGP